MANELLYKMCLWQEESLRGLYQQRLAEKISENPKVSTIDEEWENIKMVIKVQSTKQLEQIT